MYAENSKGNNMTTWHKDQPRPENLSHSSMFTVVIQQDNQNGYTMVYNTYGHAYKKMNDVGGHSFILPPKNITRK
jgi:hypothetical protein